MTGKPRATRRPQAPAPMPVYTAQDAAKRAAALAFAAKSKPVAKPPTAKYNGINGPLVTENVHRKAVPRISSSNGHNNSNVVASGPVDHRLSRLDRFQLSASQEKPLNGAVASSVAATAPSVHHTERQLLGTPLRNQKQSSLSAASANGHDAVSETRHIPPTASLINTWEETGNNASSQGRKRPNPPATSSKQIQPSLQQIQKPKTVAAPKSPKIQSITKPSPLQLVPLHDSNNLLPLITKRDLKSTVSTSAGVGHVPTQLDLDDISSNDSFVSASSVPSHQLSYRAQLSESDRIQRLSVNSPITVDSLANAMVASSLASSRAASPALPGHPPPPPRRRRFHYITESPSRPSSPTKGLKSTLRKPKSEDDDRRKDGSYFHVKKHPHKHHEGDRKRWRDEITERERKRYEAVWASNKASFGQVQSEGPGSAPLDIPGYEDTVCNLVAKDIYSRSRLERHILEEVYFLIDRTISGRLDRAEFVVGLWLIDQRLKGRKLPTRVSDSVWGSVGTLTGITVRRAGKERSN